MEKLHKCSVCHKNFKSADIVHSGILREGICKLIKEDVSDWNESSEICRNDLHFYQSKYVHLLLESEKGELTKLEHQVLDTMQQINSHLLSRHYDGLTKSGAKIRGRNVMSTDY